MENVLHQMLLSDHVGYSLVAHLLPCLRSLHSSTNSLVTYLAETVAEIRQPITIVEKGVSAEEQRKIDVQVRICSASVLCPLQFVNGQMLQDVFIALNNFITSSQGACGAEPGVYIACSQGACGAEPGVYIACSQGAYGAEPGVYIACSQGACGAEPGVHTAGSQGVCRAEPGVDIACSQGVCRAEPGVYIAGSRVV